MGAGPNMYATTMRPPTFAPGEEVKAPGRYGVMTVDSVMPNTARPGRDSDGHTYAVSGGKGGRVTVHLSGELKPFQMGQQEAR